MVNIAKTKYDDGVEALFKNAREKKFPKNQIICYQGDTLSAIHLITKGYVKAYTILDSGDTRTMFILGPGDIFPIAFSLTLDWANYEIRYFYQSLTEVTLLHMDSSSFRELIEKDSKMATSYMNYMTSSNEGIMHQLEVMKSKTAKDKIFLLLPYLISKMGEQIRPKTYRMRLKLSHQEVADLSGITRETTTSLLKELEKEGVIKQQRDTWIIYLEDDDNTSIG